MKKLNRKGFTIVELVIVIAIIAILAAVMIPTFSGVIGDAKESAFRQGARNAYVDYVAENPDEIKDDFFYVDGENWAVIKDGQFVTDGEGNIDILTENDALSKFTANEGKTVAKGDVVDGKLFGVNLDATPAA